MLVGGEDDLPRVTDSVRVMSGVATGVPAVDGVTATCRECRYILMENLPRMSIELWQLVESVNIVRATCRECRYSDGNLPKMSI